MSFSMRNHFLVSFLRQYFSLPDSMIYYISKNPSSSKVYQKLIQCCKYFFLKNPILVFHCLQINDDDGWKICSDDCGSTNFTKKVIINKETLSGCKLWIQNKLDIFITDSNYVSDLILNIFQCDAEKVLLQNQKLSFRQLLFLSQNTKRCYLDKVNVYSDADSEVPIEEILAKLPNIERFFFGFDSTSANISSDSAKKLLEIPHFKNIQYFILENISENFNIDAFYNYLKNTTTKFTFEISYQHLPSEDYAKKLERILHEILQLGYNDRLTPLIFFPYQDESTINALSDLHDKCYGIFLNP